MNTLMIEKKVSGKVEDVINRLTPELQKVGFGILTRIDFHSKINEKLNANLPPTVILGACNPSLAYQAYQQNDSVLGLLPCNIVIKETGPGSVLVQMTKPSAMMDILNSKKLVALAEAADQTLIGVLEKV